MTKHKVSFPLAIRAFGDPDILSVADEHSDGNRWRSLGRPAADSQVVLFVVHTDPVVQPDGELEGRVISARKASRTERLVYEEG